MMKKLEIIFIKKNKQNKIKKKKKKRKKTEQSCLKICHIMTTVLGIVIFHCVEVFECTTKRM